MTSVVGRCTWAADVHVSCQNKSADFVDNSCAGPDLAPASMYQTGTSEQDDQCHTRSSHTIASRTFQYIDKNVTQYVWGEVR